MSTGISADEITYGSGDDIAIDSWTMGLNLSPTFIESTVWRCRFKQEITNLENITVKYTLIASNGQSAGISYGNFFIPTTVRTTSLHFKDKQHKEVQGDIELAFDLGASQATSSGIYNGVLTIEVYEN